MQKHWYDLNGNMTTRTVGTTTYTQGWDAENRLVTVSGTGVSASFSYDGDGTRVKGTVNGTVTAYVGNWFEWTGSTSTMKKYYDAGAQRIAMRTGSGTGTSGLLWIIGDHLGSTTKIANYDGTLNSQRRYKPWGEARYGGALPTTFAFTGQRQEVQLGGSDGLYEYGARWYDAALGRWLSPDSIIPEAAQGVQAWSRYTYVNNAPTRYQDQTGHSVDCAVGEAGCGESTYPPDTGDVFSVTVTIGAGPLFWVGDLDVVFTDDQIGVFTGLSIGPALDGSKITNVSASPEDEFWTYVTPQADLSFGLGNVLGEAVDKDVRNYQGTVKATGYSFIFYSQNHTSSVDPLTDQVDDRIQTDTAGPTIGVPSVEGHSYYMRSSYWAGPSDFLTGLFK